MIPSLTTLLSTAAGKIAIGVVVATTSVGAAAAAGAEVPFVSAPSEVAVTVEDTGEVDGSADAQAPADGPAEDSLATGESAVQALELPAGVDDDDVEEDAAVEGEDGERPENHGAVVSGFVHETELEGCEKGQATAAVARGDIEPGEDGSIDPAAVDAYLAESGKCLDDEVDDDEVEEASAETERSTGKPDHAGKGKPDHAGKGGKSGK